MKAEARHMVAETIGDLARHHPQTGIHVRLNALETGMTGDEGAWPSPLAPGGRIDGGAVAA